MTALDDFDPTDKQSEILRLVFSEYDAGRTPSFEEIKQGLSYGPGISKQAMSCSLKILERWGAVELVYGDSHGAYKPGLRCYVRPTPVSYRRFRVTGSL